MHPILARRQTLVLYLAAWLLVGLLGTLVLVLTDVTGWPGGILFSVPMAVLYAFMCLAPLYLWRAFPPAETSVFRLLLIFLVASFLTASLWTFAGRGWAVLLSSLDPSQPLEDRFGTILPVLFAAGMFLFLLAAVAHSLVLAFEASRQAERRAWEMTALAREAELRTLRFQVQPHFLFNSLNSISALMTAQPQAARTMVEGLSDFLRATLKLGSEDAIPLSQELSLIHQYLSLERIRLGSRLQIEECIDDASGEIPVPPLLLLPLVENAVRHGIGGMVAGGTLALRSEVRHAHVTLTVVNPYDPAIRTSPGSGLGIHNVRQRLYRAYGADARLDIEHRDGVFRVEMRIPATFQTPGAA